VLNNLKAPYARWVSRGDYKGGGLTSFKVVLAGGKRDYWYTRGFCQRHSSSIRGGFLKAPVELLDIASMSVRCSAGPTMPLRDSEKPADSFVEPPESLRGITIPGAAEVIAHSSGDGLLGGVETPRLETPSIDSQKPVDSFCITGR
jgi:hypothetical protein